MFFIAIIRGLAFDLSRKTGLSTPMSSTVLGKEFFVFSFANVLLQMTSKSDNFLIIDYLSVYSTLD